MHSEMLIGLLFLLVLAQDDAHNHSRSQEVNNNYYYYNKMSATTVLHSGVTIKQQQPPSQTNNNHHQRTQSQQQPSLSNDVLKLFTNPLPLDAIFNPNSVALIGASEKVGSVGRTVLWNLLSSPFGGTIYPVNHNPIKRSVFGIKSYTRVQDIPDVMEMGIDLVIIAVPAHAVKEVMEDCVEVGVRGAIILSAGFKEVGMEGAQLEREICEIARRGKIRVVGPNCLGLQNPISGLNATFANNLARPGNVAFISQSGAMCTSILDWSLQANVGFSAFVSVGSMMDVSWGDIIYYLGDDPNTKAIAIYMESIGDARSFMSAASEVAMMKPIIVIKPGRTSQAAKAAASHTGSLAGSDDVLEAAFKRCGVLRVNKIRDVFEIVELLGKQPRPSGKYLTILTNAGGPGVISTDALIESGGQLAWLSEDTMNKLNEILPSHWSHANPIDILGDATWETYAKALEIAAENKYSDGILIILTPQSMTNPTRTAEAIAKVAKKISKPILASWMGGKAVTEGRAILDAAGIPTYDYPDSAADNFTYMYQLSVNLTQLYETPRWCADLHPSTVVVDTIIATAQSQDRVILTELESKRLLSCYSIATPAIIHCRTAEEAASAASSIGFPVVAKLHSETITHKSDVGGVKLNLHSPEQVRDAFFEIQQGVEKDDFLGVTVQPMLDTTDAFELIVGSSLDAQFGPVMLFGLGGTLVEVFQDSSIALPPLNSNLAHLMMKNTKIYTALKGIRGRKSADIAAIEKLIVNFSHLVMDKWMFIKEIEINPLLATHDSVIALDARVILHDSNMMDVDDEVSRQTQIIRPAIRPYPAQYEQHWLSKKGRVLLIRAIMPEDEPLVVDFHKRISEESVYTRWMSNMNYDERASHSRLIRVCHVDYDRDIALVALDEESCAGKNCKLVAAGRLTKMHGKNVAEFSVLVEDDWQGEGLGAKLLLELIKHGEADGLDGIEGIVLPTNRAMIHVAEKMGFESVYDKELNVVKQYFSYKEAAPTSKAKEDYDIQLRRFTCPINI